MSDKYIDVEVPTEEGNFVRLKDLEAGTVFEGTFTGTTMSSNFDKPEHRLTLADGEKIIINGSTQLNTLMNEVSSGSQVKIEYLGKTYTIQKGPYAGKKAHAWKVGAFSGEEVEAGGDLLLVVHTD